MPSFDGKNRALPGRGGQQELFLIPRQRVNERVGY